MAHIAKNAPTETLEQYLARGGKITIGKPESRKRRKVVEETTDEEVEAAVEPEIDMSLVPADLKIVLGIKD